MAKNKKQSVKKERQVLLSNVEKLLLDSGLVFGFNCTILLRMGHLEADPTKPIIQILSVKAIHEE